MGFDTSAQILRVESVIRWHYRDVARGGDGINDPEVLSHIEGMRPIERIARLRTEGESEACDDPDDYVATSRQRKTKKKTGGQKWQAANQQDVAVAES